MLPRLTVRLALICVLLSLGPARAAETACPDHYLDGRPPTVADLPATAVELCNEAYAVEWSPVTRDPVYAAEHLTVEGLMKARKVERHDAFFADPRLGDHGALLHDYKGSPFDRGHQAPDHDMPTAKAMTESFSLANMAPQNPSLNRGPWAVIEASACNLVVSQFQTGQGWVVTGPVFSDHPPMLNSRVAIPEGFFKALYVPGDSFGNPTVVGAWIVKNAAEPETRFVSIAALAAETGIDAFPSLPSDLRDKASLPASVAKRTGVAGGM